MAPLDQIELDEDGNIKESHMPFVEHLEQLRWHIIRAVASVLIVGAGAFVMKDFVFDVLIFGPTKDWFITYRAMCSLSHKLGLGETLCMTVGEFRIINIEMSGQFLMHLQAAAVIGIVVAFPYIFWEIWRFIKPGLRKKEVQYTQGVIFFTSILFVIGVLFGYLILTPFAVNFFATYKVSETVANDFTLTNYVSFLTMFTLLSGLIFELPMAVYFLSKLGLVTPQFMRDYRRHAVVIMLIVSAIITPADVGTQLLVFIPLYMLYEISIFISANVVKNMEKDDL